MTRHSGSYVVNTSDSPHARLRPVAVSAVRIEDNLWLPRQVVNKAVMLPAQYRLCEDTGRIDNLRIAGDMIQGEFRGIFFNDSDVYKWLEAAAWSLAWEPDPELEAQMDVVVEAVVAAQGPDGYLNSYFMGERAGQRFTNFDLHEMYCAGHLFQAAVAYARTAGKTRLLDVACRLADHLCATFGPPEQGKRTGVDGHPEVELALVELYRQTGERRYLEQAQYFIDARGQRWLSEHGGRRDPAYYQDRLPFRQMARMEGHAVRAAYLNAGAADLYAETGDTTLMQALDQMWDNMTGRQMFIHGGLGPRYENEGFGTDYELPNQHAHAESCAAVANAMWNWRMLLLTGEGRYADIMELALYNNVLAGVSLDGRGYFYENPLRDDGNHRRQEWFDCACCPSNISRAIACLPGYVYGVSAEGAWLHLYVANQASLPLPDGRVIHLAQQTDYPWSGRVEVQLKTAGEYSLYLRLPDWCEAGWTLALNGTSLRPEAVQDGYLHVRRAWTEGDRLVLDLPMPVRLVESHPNVSENLGRAAVMRGPLLYCLESIDNDNLDVRRLVLPQGAGWEIEMKPDLLGGVVVLKRQATLLEADQTVDGRLYRPLAFPRPPGNNPVSIQAIPYYAWANREAGPMEVWVRKGY